MDLANGRSDQRSRFLLASLSAPPGTYKCRVVLRNLETGQAAVAGASAVVPEDPGDKLILLPPLLVTEDPAALLLSGNQTEHGLLADAPTAQGFLFDLKGHAPLLGNELAAGSPIGAVIRCSGPDGDISGLELSARLDSQASGQSREIRPLIIGKRAEKTVQAFLIGLEIPQVAPGPYKLVLAVSDTRSGQSSRISRNFLIK
jgi:hypothetical protein